MSEKKNIQIKYRKYTVSAVTKDLHTHKNLQGLTELIPLGVAHSAASQRKFEQETAIAAVFAVSFYDPGMRTVWEVLVVFFWTPERTP